MIENEAGELKLLKRDDTEVKIPMRSNSLLVFNCNDINFSCAPHSKESLAAVAWLMSSPKEWVPEQMSGSAEDLYRVMELSPGQALPPEPCAYVKALATLSGGGGSSPSAALEMFRPE